MPHEPSTTLKERAKRLLHEGNVRHLVVEKDGRRVADLPLTIVFVAALVAIWLVVLLAILALLLECKVSIEKHASLVDEPSPAAAQTPDDDASAGLEPLAIAEPAEPEMDEPAAEVEVPVPHTMPAAHPPGAEEVTPVPPALTPFAGPPAAVEAAPTAADDPVAAFEPPPSPEAWQPESRS